MDDSYISPHRPHDQFFKQIFSNKENVISFLEGTLPKDLLKMLDFSSLELDNNNYLTPELKESFADVVYGIEAGKQKIRLAFLFEHKSYVEEQPYLQLLTYMLGHWKHAVANEAEKLPIVVPMVIYHGEGRWKHQPFEAYFDGGAWGVLQAYIPRFNYWLTNLQTESDEEIVQRYKEFILQKGFLFMKYIRDQELLDKLDQLLAGFEELVKDPNMRIYFRSFYVYLVSGKIKNREKIMEKTKSIVETWGFEEGSMAHQWFTQGWEKGKELGIRKGMDKELDNSIKKMLIRGFSPEQVADILEVDLARVLKIADQLK